MKIFFRFLGDVVTQRLEGVEHSDSKFKNNWLIYLIHVNNLPVYATDSDEGMQNYLNCNASDLKKSLMTLTSMFQVMIRLIWNLTCILVGGTSEL